MREVSERMVPGGGMVDTRVGVTFLPVNATRREGAMVFDWVCPHCAGEWGCISPGKKRCPDCGTNVQISVPVSKIRRPERPATF